MQLLHSNDKVTESLFKVALGGKREGCQCGIGVSYPDSSARTAWVEGDTGSSRNTLEPRFPPS